jgi:hypothetical protein
MFVGAGRRKSPEILQTAFGSAVTCGCTLLIRTVGLPEAGSWEQAEQNASK